MQKFKSKRNNSQKHGFIFVLTTLSILIFFVHCKPSEWFGARSESNPGIVVIFTNGEVEIIRTHAEKTESISPKQGMVLFANDQIKTGSGSIDLQSPQGNLLRIKAYTNLKLESLGAANSGQTTVNISWGELLVKTKKLKSNDDFQVKTPTAVAGVRGTTFSVELEKDKIPKIKVFEGSVAISFRMDELKEIQKDPLEKESYEKLISLLESKEVILGATEESQINPTFHEIFHLINYKKDGELPSIEKIDKLVTDSDNLLQKSNFEITPQKQAEVETLVPTREELITESIANQEIKDESKSEEIENKIAANHKEEMENAIGNIETRANEKKLESEKDIQNYYSILEIVNMSNGEKLSGAIITQIGDTIILHSTKGTTRLELSDIEFVEYKSFKLQTKTKK
ncbi:FecR family protein [Leptospira sp. GIMC2001]|uniref:FecR family protein n=1 Tax=Leptospira sp. GIMC2001 TaxID=1513297 RepID=UPI0004A5C5C4|nr:FecR family protein [Leptospira sp. GIMC2001]AID56205.1 LipL45 protein [Leptospira sp. GIMC2001]WCL48607.1 FecR family protein [Leptospira sp. GIMC2001]